MEDVNILYILIGSGSKPLAGYSPYQGEFIQICERQLSQCKPGSAALTHSDFKIYYSNEDNITYMIMTNTKYSMPTAVACLESMKKEYGSILEGRNFSILNNYGLNSELQPKLKMTYEYYVTNTEVVSEKLEGLKEVMNQFRDEVVKAADALNVRGEELIKMEEKANILKDDSYSFKKGAIQVRKTECKRKWGLTIGIILVVGAIIGIIIWAAS